MKKIIIVAVLLLLAGLVYKKMPGNKIAKPETVAEEFSGTLAQAMKLGVPMKCEWQTSEGSGESFVKGNDMYLKTMMAGKTGYMIKKGDCVHTWSEGQKQGIKFCQTAEETVQSDKETAWQPDSDSYQAEGVDWNVQYKCRPEIFAGDRFELPADVQFLDMAETLKGLVPDLPQLPLDE